MFQYAIEVLKARKKEIESHFADICRENGGELAVLDAQNKVLDIDDALSVLCGLRDDLKKDGYLSDSVEGDSRLEGGLVVEGDAILESGMSFECEEEFFE